MTDEKTTPPPADKMPAFRMQKLYIKDLSFENPTAPEVFFLQETSPKVDFNLKMKNQKLDDDHWEVAISITAKITDEKSGKILFIVELEHAGAFLLKNIPEEHIPKVLAVECPTILFPFTRQIVSQMSVDGGFIPFLMEPINFLALYDAKIRQQQGETKGQQH